MAFAVGSALVLIILVVAAHHRWAIQIDAGHPEPNSESLVSIHHLQPVWIIVILVTAISALGAIGRSGLFRIWIFVLDAIRTIFGVRYQRFRAFIDKQRTKTMPSDTAFLRIIVILMSIATLSQVTLLVILTGGMINSPFLQIAVSSFIWQTFLSNDLKIRLFVALEAVLFFGAVYLIHPYQLQSYQAYRLAFVGFITGLNIVFVLVPLVFKDDGDGK